MESFDFVIVAVMKQQIIRFVKPQTLQFKNLAVISFWHRLGLIAWRLPLANKQLRLYILVYRSALWPLLVQSRSQGHSIKPMLNLL